MKIKTRILGLVLLLLSLMSGAAAVALLKVGQVGETIEEVTEADMPLMESLTRVLTSTLQQGSNFERALRFAPGTEAGDASLAIPMKEAKAEFDRLSGVVKKALDDAGAALRAKERFLEGGDRYELVPFEKALLDINEAYVRYEKRGSAILELLVAGSVREAKLELLSTTGDETRLRSSLDSLARQINRVKDAAATSARQAERTARQSVGFITALSLLLGSGLAFIITRSITTPLKVAATVADRIAHGDKEVEVALTYKGEVGQLLSTMATMLEAVRNSERTLEQRAEELARSNRELEQFAYVASHDLQEPLRMVTLYSQLIVGEYKEKLDDEAKEYFDTITEAVARMQSLINDILSYSRVGSRRRAPAPTPLAKVVQSALETLGPAIQERNATIHEIPELPHVLGDATQLGQLYQNLIGNALKFTTNTPPQIWIGASNEEGRTVFHVKDNGIGIAPEFSEKVFEIFERLHADEQYSGTGIGLAICKKIVEQHGGKIWVDSVPGAGAAFKFTLPLSH